MYALLLATLLLGAEPKYTGIVWVHSATCVPCAKMEPVVDKLLIEGQPIIIVKITTQKELEERYKSKYVPTTIVYKQGVELHKEVGVIEEQQLRKWLSETKDE